MSTEFFRHHNPRQQIALKQAKDAMEAAQALHHSITRFGAQLERITSGYGYRSLRLKDGIVQSFWAKEFDTSKRVGAVDLMLGPMAEALLVGCPVCKSTAPVLVLREEYGTYGGNGMDLPTEEVCYSFCTRCTQLHKVSCPEAR